MKYNQILAVIAIVNATGILTGIAGLSTNYEKSSQVNQLQLLVIISTQYGNDKDIYCSIQNYLYSVENDLGWRGEIVILNNNDNYQEIDNIIESYFEMYKIKACILVGEDIDTPIGGMYNDFVKPSVVPWSTMESYDLYDDMVVSKIYRINICISLIYPIFDTKYEDKKNQIVSVFNRFTSQRNIKYGNKTLVIESSDVNVNSKTTYQSLVNYTGLNYLEDPGEDSIEELFNEMYSMYIIHGHSSPAATCINSAESYFFKATSLSKINSPIFAADGCYTNGWKLNNNSNYKTQLFNNDDLQVMFLGLLTQNNEYFQTNFIENTIPEILDGKTVAEAMIGDLWLGDVVLYGDPTFHL